MCAVSLGVSPHVLYRVVDHRHWKEGSICATHAPTVPCIAGHTNRRHGFSTSRVVAKCYSLIRGCSGMRVLPTTSLLRKADRSQQLCCLWRPTLVCGRLQQHNDRDRHCQPVRLRRANQLGPGAVLEVKMKIVQGVIAGRQYTKTRGHSTRQHIIGFSLRPCAFLSLFPLLHLVHPIVGLW